MTDDEIRIAVADASGLKARYGLRKRGLWYRPNASGYTGMSDQAGRYTLEEAKKHEYIRGCDDDVKIAALPLPDYLEDLNAMHEVEKTLDAVQRGRYSTLLAQRDEKTFTWDFDTIHATARQRCEAYLRTIGRWKE